MKVALVHDHLNQYGGAERVLKGLTELFPKAPIFTLVYDKNATNSEFEKKEIHTSFLQRIPFAVTHHRSFPLLMPLAIEHLNLQDYDLVISDSENFAKGVIKAPHAKHICFCHTPPRFLWDGWQQHLAQSTLPRAVKAVAPLGLSYLRFWDYEASRRVDYFLANSHFVAKRIKKYYRQDATVIYPPVSIKALAQKAGKRKKGFLLLMRLVPYKRPEIVIDAFNQLGLELTVVGEGPLFNSLQARAKANITFVGALEHKRIARYYQQAQALIFPQEEDFGISAVEACACGTPVIAFNAGGAKEIIKENVNGLFFHEQTSQSIINAIKTFQKMKFDDKLIKESVNQFDETRFKKQFKNFVESLIPNS